MRVALLAGGTGGAKLGAGLQEEIGGELAVIANTADDIEVLGVHVSPDPDLVTYWLSGEIDAERGWGIRDDSFAAFERLSKLGAPDWFSLSDRDLAACLYRRTFLDEGGRHTDAQAQIARGLGVAARVLPMSEARVRTSVTTAAGRRGLQEYLILDGGKPEVTGVELDGIAEATPTPEVLAALAAAEAIVIGPSNPVISIGPILAVPGMREAIAASGAPVVAVSPYVAGQVVKGPTERFMAAVGRPSNAAGVASLYAGLIDAMVVDEGDPDPPPTEVPTLAAPTLMDGAAGRARLARTVLDYAERLASGPRSGHRGPMSSD
jgi:LPPG:FO 2-phospho-L-lactate transferase